MTRVLVIDDHPMVLQGCRQVLEDAGIEEIYEASTTLEGFRLYRQKTPDIIVADLGLQNNGLAGLKFIRRIRLHDQRTPILVFTMHGDTIVVRRALEMGANGYVLKDAGPKEFLEGFVTVLKGLPYLNHELSIQVALLRTGNNPGKLDNVTPRELQTLALLAEGKSYHQIASHLGVSYKTVANTSSILKSKLGAPNLPGLIRMAIQFLSMQRE